METEPLLRTILGLFLLSLVTLATAWSVLLARHGAAPFLPQQIVPIRPTREEVAFWKRLVADRRAIGLVLALLAPVTGLWLIVHDWRLLPWILDHAQVEIVDGRIALSLTAEDVLLAEGPAAAIAALLTLLLVPCIPRFWENGEWDGLFSRPLLVVLALLLPGLGGLAGTNAHAQLARTGPVITAGRDWVICGGDGSTWGEIADIVAENGPRGFTGRIVIVHRAATQRQARACAIPDALGVPSHRVAEALNRMRTGP